MLRTALASAAFVALAQATGQAIVVNSCSYDVYLANTPSAGGGYSAIDQTLSSGSSYSQTYTELSNGNGWSLKLSKTAGAFESNILQYEYTYHDDGTIWFDLSEVNGNPWDGNWEITANDGCSPRQAAYRYATDDAYGMQSCGDDSSITVTLCSGDSGSGSASASASPSSAAPTTSSAAATSSAAPATTSSATTSSTTSTVSYGGGHHTWGLSEDKVEAPAGDAVLDDAKATIKSSSTLATVVTTENGGAVTVTNVHMETLTKYVTATAAPAAKRHEHHPRHPHRR